MRGTAYIGSYSENEQYALCVLVLDEDNQVRYHYANVYPDTQGLQEVAGELKGVYTVVKWMRWAGEKSGIDALDICISNKMIYDWCVSETAPEDKSAAFLYAFLCAKKDEAIHFCLSDAPQIAACCREAEAILQNSAQKKAVTGSITDVLQKARAMGIPVTPMQKQKQAYTNEQAIRELSTLELAQLLSRQGYGKDTQLLVEWLKKPYN